jgi:hypothetical protein
MASKSRTPACGSRTPFCGIAGRRGIVLRTEQHQNACRVKLTLLPAIQNAPYVLQIPWPIHIP